MNHYLTTEQVASPTQGTAQRGMTRGERNCNPLNIRRSEGTRWLGQCTKQWDREFVQFQSMLFGFRAAFRILRTYFKVQGLDTLHDIIYRWAPPEDNSIIILVSTFGFIVVCTLIGFAIDYFNGKRHKSVRPVQQLRVHRPHAALHQRHCRHDCHDLVLVLEREVPPRRDSAHPAHRVDIRLRVVAVLWFFVIFCTNIHLFEVPELLNEVHRLIVGQGKYT